GTAGAGIWILYGDGKCARRTGAAGGGELRGGDEVRSERRGVHVDDGAVEKFAAVEGERKISEICRRGRNTGEERSGREERDGGGGGFGGVGDAGGSEGDRVGIGDCAGRGVIARRIHGADCGVAAGGGVDGPGDGGVRIARDFGGKGIGIAGADGGGGGR